MYKAFFNPLNIEHQVRQIRVTDEEETLKMDFTDNLLHKLGRNYHQYVKYVSTRSVRPGEIYLYWDSQVEGASLKRLIEKIKKEPSFLTEVDQDFKTKYQTFAKYSLKTKRNAQKISQSNTEQLIKLLKEYFRHTCLALLGYYEVYEILHALSEIVNGEVDPGDFEILTTEGIKTYLSNNNKQSLAAGKALSRYRNNPVLHSEIIWLRKFLQYRNKDAEMIRPYSDNCQVLLDVAAKRLNIPVTDLYLLSQDEITQGLLNKLDVKKIITDRKKLGFTIKAAGGKVVVITGVSSQDNHVQKIKGNKVQGKVASSGLVKGKVKIILDASLEGAKFKKNDILVTSMTTPRFLSLMQKAAAIVTDEGGLLCHAAIVARELGIPCIIGTRNATQILKDNQLVEVDAHSGMVTIINGKD